MPIKIRSESGFFLSAMRTVWAIDPKAQDGLSDSMQAKAYGHQLQLQLQLLAFSAQSADLDSHF
jgi:hypothetical protein